MSAAGDFIIMAERGMDGKFTKVPVEPIVQTMEVKEENKEEELQISKRLAVLENLMLKSQVDADQKLVAMMQKTDARFMQVMELMQGKSDSETDRSDATHFDYQTPRNEGRPLKIRSTESEEEVRSDLEDKMKSLPMKERDNRNVEASMKQNIMLVSAEVTEFTEQLRQQDLNPLGIWTWLEKVEEHDRTYGTEIQLWRKLSKVIMENDLDIQDISVARSNNAVKSALMKYASELARYQNTMVTFFSSPLLIKAKISRGTAEKDPIHIIRTALNVLKEYNKAYAWYAKLVGHDPANGHFNGNVFPDHTAKGVKKQKVVEFWKAYMLNDAYLSELINQKMENILQTKAKVGWEVVTKHIEAHLESQIDPARITMQHLEDYDKKAVSRGGARIFYKSGSNYGNSYNKVNEDKTGYKKYTKPLNNVEPLNEKLDYEKAENDEEVELDLEETTTISQILQRDQEEELNELNQSDKNQACIAMIKSGVCKTRDTCKYNHTLSEQVREMCKYSNMMEAFREANLEARNNRR